MWNLVPYVSVMMLARATELSRRGHLAVLAAVGAFISVVGYAVGLSIDVMPNQPLAIVHAFMLTQAVAWTTYGLAPLVKQFLPGVAIGLFVLLSIPSSGGAIPHQLVPGFFAALHPVMPLGNVVDALRGIFSFDGVGLLRPTLVLGAWLVGSASLVTLVAVRSRLMERRAGQPQGEVTAPEPVEDPTLMASVPRAIDPRRHGPYREESALLGGVVRKEDGAPLRTCRRRSRWWSCWRRGTHRRRRACCRGQGTRCARTSTSSGRRRPPLGLPRRKRCWPTGSSAGRGTPRCEEALARAVRPPRRRVAPPGMLAR